MKAIIIDRNRRTVIFQQVLRYLLAFGLAIAVGVLIVVARHENPLKVYKMLVWGALGTPLNFMQTIRWSTPLIMAGLANLIAFRAGIWNLDVETQLQFGALAAAVVGNLPGLTPAVHIPLTIMVSTLAGAFWAFIPAILYVRFRVNELVTTLMMGYIGTLLIQYLLRYHFHAPFAPGASPNNIATADIAQSARLPQLVPSSEASVSIFIAIALCFVLFFLYRKTVLGYEADVLGLNRRFATYGGIKSSRVMLILFLLSGAVAGLAGGLEIMGSQYNYSSLFPTGLGFDGIVVGILSQNGPLAVIPAGLFFGILRNGGYVVEQTTNVNRAAISVIQGLILLFFTVQIVWPAIRVKLAHKDNPANRKEKKENG